MIKRLYTPSFFKNALANDKTRCPQNNIKKLKAFTDITAKKDHCGTITLLHLF
jgi:hypothetical protein